MKFNHKQKLTALGHVIAFLAITFVGYVSFLGLSYLRQGDIVQTAMMVAAYGAAFFLLCAYLQRLKGTDRHFRSRIWLERLVALLLLVACIPLVVPFTHFFTVNSHEREVTTAFHNALAEVMPIFDEYDSIANQRIDDYESRLKKAAASKKQRASYGLDRHTLGKPNGGDTLMIANMVETLRLHLLSPAHDTLRSEAKRWIGRAKGATTWNVFLLGNAREIRQAVENWQQTLSDAMAVKLDNERSLPDSVTFESTHCQTAIAQLEQVAQLCSERAAPPPYAFALLIACWLLLFFPHWLQNRHSKSWELFWGKSLTRFLTRQRSARFVADQMVTVPLDISDCQHDDFILPVTEASRFKKDMQKVTEERQIPTFTYLTDRFNQGLTHQQVLSMVQQDHNLFDADIIGRCLQSVVLTKQMLEDCGIDRAFIDKIGAVPRNVLPDAPPISQLDGTSTQVFLWGLPSAGKTCAVGVVLAALREGKVAKKVTFDENCQGYGYLQQLQEIFTADGDMCVLPGRTPVASNFAIRMDLDDFNGRVHPVTLVDMAGELFCTIAWEANGNADNITARHRKAKEEFERVLTDSHAEHQKFHIFIIEYGAQNRRYKGLYQDLYLEYGLQYLKETGVLERGTQGIYVLVTKTDQVKGNLAEGEDEATHLQRYLKSYYGNFLRTLNSFCHDYELCGGQLPPPIPFDIGEVCFGNYCRLSTRRAQDVVRLIMGRSKGFRTGWQGRIERIFNQ